MQLARRSGGGASGAATCRQQPRLGGGARPCVPAAASGLQQRQRQQQRRHSGSSSAAQPARAPRSRVAARASAAADGGGDVVRPSAKAAAPPAVSLPDLDGSSSSSSSSAGPSPSPHSGSGSRPPSSGAAASGSGAGAGSSRAASYSDFYRLVHSVNSVAGSAQQQQQQQQQQTHRQTPQHAEPGGSHGNGADASTQTPAAAGSGAAALAQPLPSQQQQQQQRPGGDAAGVEDALRKAQQALAAAESSLGSIHRLRSARPPSQWAGLLQALRSTATAVAVGAFLVASHAFGLGWQWAGATIGALALAALAFKQGTVTEAGAVAAASAALATLGCSLRFGLVLLMAAYSSFKLRQLKEARAPPDLSAAPAADAAAPAQRDWLDIACVAAAPTALAVVYGAMAGCLDLPLGSLPAVETWRADLLTLLQGAVLGWYACVCGDAWSSELGALSRDQPRLLTTLKPVRRGTHGGVTLLGLSGAAAGGLLVGLVFYCAAVLSPTLWVFEAQRAAAMAQWRVVPLGLMAGLFGSLLDSLLGGALQFTGYDPARGALTSTPGPGVQRIAGLRLRWLNDRLVDVAAAAVTAALTALAALATFG